VFEHKENFVVRANVENFNEPKNIRMLEKPHEADFPLELREANGGADQVDELDALDRVARASTLINTKIDLGRGAATDFLPKKVLIDLLEGARSVWTILGDRCERPRRSMTEHQGVDFLNPDDQPRGSIRRIELEGVTGNSDRRLLGDIGEIRKYMEQKT
jgi:hypothetical protein